jgi:tRNA U34 2-thiouridine synthase MnmA/TrmU
MKISILTFKKGIKRYNERMVKKKAKALVLFSGGLDSILVVKILQEQKIKLTALIFKSYFFNEEQAKKTAKELKIPFEIANFSKKHLKIVMNPKYGYGKNMNPCIDCHALMLKEAAKIMKMENYDFIATGEVLGERPMSQNKGALKIIEKESDLENKIVRPLSAKLLESTFAEKNNFIKRKGLFDVSGKSRKKQLKLAKKFKLKSFPTPAGGCILTDKDFSKKMRELLGIWEKNKRNKKYWENDIKLLKIGRHFKKDSAKIIIGRDEEENKRIKKLALKNDILIEMKNYPGPLTLIRSYIKEKGVKEKIMKEGKNLTKYYSTKSRNKKDAIFCVKEI